MQFRHLSTRLLVPMCVGVAATVLPAATTNWINNGGGAFGSAGNWDNGVPDAADTAVFRRGAIPLYPVFLGSFMNPNPEHRTVDRLIIGTNTLTMAGLAGSTLTVDGTDTSETGRGLIIGQTPTDVAVLNNALGGLSTPYATLGSAAGSSGTLNVVGGPFNVTGLTPTYDLIVGLFGSGVINVSDGRQVNVGDATALGLYGGASGTITVNGAGSHWDNSGGILYVGRSGTGAVSLTGGGQLAAQTLSIASETGSSGDIDVIGPDSAITVGSGGTLVGYRGTASMDITAGGSVTSTTGYVGYGTIHDDTSNPGVGTALVDGAGSTWSNSAPLYVGSYYTTGTLTISNGAQVTSTYGQIGYDTGTVVTDRSIGTVNISGSTSLWNNSLDLYVGNGPRSDGTLSIAGGARVNSRSGYVGNQTGSTGIVTIAGFNSRWVNAVSLYVGAGGGSGSLTVTDSGAVQAATITIHPLGEVRGNGTLIGNTQNGGLVEPGTSVGTLSVTGSYTQTIDGQLQVELASASSFDRLLVTGGATLGGTLEISLLDGFSPPLGQAFVILTCGARVGTFSNVTGMAAGPGRIFRPQYNPANVTLVVGLPAPGDFDLDDDVDQDDLDLFEACASGPGVPIASGCEGRDFDNDGDADQSDFAIVQRCYSGADVPGDPNCAN